MAWRDRAAGETLGEQTEPGENCGLHQDDGTPDSSMTRTFECGRFIYLSKAYSPVNRTGTPQGFCGRRRRKDE